MSAPNPNGHTVQQVRDIAADLRKIQSKDSLPFPMAIMDPERIDWLCDDHASLLEQVAKLRGALEAVRDEWQKSFATKASPATKKVLDILAETQEGGI